MPEPEFVPKDGQVDYTHARYCPVINAVVTNNGKVLLVRRSPHMRLYPDCWHCIAGFLDDNQSVEEKIIEEVNEEAGIARQNITAIKHGTVLLHEAPEYNKTFIIVPALVTVDTDKFKLNWESEAAKWYDPGEVPSLNLMPGFLKVFQQFF